MAQTTQSIGASVLVQIAAPTLLHNALESNDAIEIVVTKGAASTALPSTT
ncbi:MAG: hypothetical protein JOZ54_01885 [Acidobacteria bacterium]|nr:hypothetical protein [Acidobacteriota bacterium]